MFVPEYSSICVDYILPKLVLVILPYRSYNGGYLEGTRWGKTGQKTVPSYP